MKITDFINFQINEADKQPGKSKDQLITVFFEALGKALKENNDRSYSVFASDSKFDPDRDMKSIMSSLAEEGWKKDAVDNLFAKFGDTMVEMYDNGEGHGEAPGGSGLADLFFYKMGHAKNILLGYQIKESDDGDTFVKYSYGYHKTKYGKLCLISQFGSLEKWFAYISSLFVHVLCQEKDEGFYTDTKVMDYVKSSHLAKDWVFSTMHKSYKYDINTETGTIDLALFEAKISGEELKKFETAILAQLGSMGFKTSESPKAPPYDTRCGGEATLKDGKIEIELNK